MCSNNYCRSRKIPDCATNLLRGRYSNMDIPFSQSIQFVGRNRKQIIISVRTCKMLYMVVVLCQLWWMNHQGLKQSLTYFSSQKSSGAMWSLSLLPFSLIANSAAMGKFTIAFNSYCPMQPFANIFRHKISSPTQLSIPSETFCLWHIKYRRYWYDDLDYRWS